VYVFLLVTIVSRAKTAEPIEVPFGTWSQARPRNRVLDAAGGSGDAAFRCQLRSNWFAVGTVRKRQILQQWRQSRPGDGAIAPPQ